MKEKRLVEFISVDIPLPVSFSIFVSPDAPDQTILDADNLERIRKRLEAQRRKEGGSSILINSVGTPQEIMEELKNCDDANSIYLRDIYVYFFNYYLDISNFKTKNEIESPKSTEFLPLYYYVFLIGLNSYNKDIFTKKDLKKLIDAHISSDIAKLKTYISNIIIKNLGVVKPDFYVSYELEAELYDLLPEERRKDLITSLTEFRETFAEVVIANHEHPICSDVRVAWEKPSEEVFIPDSLVNPTIKISWPSVTVLQRQQFVIDPKFSVYYSDLYICELARFEAHLRSPGLAKFCLDMSEFMTKQVDELYAQNLTRTLIKGKFLNTAGELDVKSMDREKFIECCVGFTATFFRKYGKDFSQDIKKKFVKIVQGILDAGQRKVEILKNHLEGFTPIKAFALLLQVLEIKSSQVDPELKDLFLPENLIDNIKSTVMDLFSIDRYVSSNSPPSTNFPDPDSHKKLFELSVKITSQIKQGRSFILHTGTPIKEGNTYSEHAFYIVFKRAKESNDLKIIVVNGGLAHGMQDIDTDYVEQDRGFGGMWKCRETVNMDLNKQFLNFLKHYIYKALFLPHLPSTDADTKNVMKEIYFRNPEFLGYCNEKLTFQPVMNDKPTSFPSQVFGNCVVYNLFYAMKFLFELNAAQFTMLTDQLRCSYNYLLYQNDKWMALKYKTRHDGSATASSKCISIERPYILSSMADTINVENSDLIATSYTDPLFNEHKDVIISDHKSFYDGFLRILRSVPYQQVEDVLQTFLRIEEETILDDLRASNDFDEFQKSSREVYERFKQNKKVRQEFLEKLGHTSPIDVGDSSVTAETPFQN